MSEKNADVERALAAFGGVSLTYHSFGPFTMRPRTNADTRAFTYNEFGEASFAPAQPEPPVASLPPSGAETLYDTLPVVQPPLSRPTAASPASVQVPPMSAAPIQRTAAPRPVAPQPTARVVPPPAAPMPPPFFPLLAAALPNATEPTYTPSHPTAPPPSYASRPQAAAVTPVDSQGNLAGHGAMPAGAVGGAGESADRRSLTEMFRLLSGRSDGTSDAAAVGGAPAGVPRGAPAQAASTAAEEQALFRRI